MATTTTPDEDASVVIEYEEGFGYAARHVDSGVSSQGETEALVALAEALALHCRSDEESREPTAEWYDRHGLSPADARSGDEPLPDCLR
jgi:predicted RNase H-like HicB family nuclease